MNTEQWMGLVRQLLPVLGGIAVSFGWLTKDQVAGVTATILQISGPAMILASTIWSVWTNTKASLATKVAAMPEVKEVVLHPTEAARDIAQATPPNVKIDR